MRVQVPSAQMAHMPPQHQGPSQPEEDPDARGGGQAAEEMRRWVVVPSLWHSKLC